MIAGSAPSVKVMMAFLKSEICKNIGTCFNQWTRSVTHNNVGFAAINSNLKEIENLQQTKIDLKKVMSSSEVKTCISASNRVFDSTSQDLGSLIDNLEMGNRIDFDLNQKEAPELGSSDSLVISLNKNYYFGGGSVEDLSMIDFSRTLSRNSTFKKND